MKKAVILILLSGFIMFPVFSEENDDDAFTFSFSGAPMELSVHVFAEIDFSTFPPPFGPMAEFIILPFAIKTGPETKNYLGIGAQGGAYFYIADQFFVIPVVAGIFVGRFSLSKSFILDIDARLGVMIGDSAVLYGAAGIGLKLFVPFESRIYAGIEFTGNPYYDPLDYYSPSLVYCFVIGYGFYIMGSGK